MARNPRLFIIGYTNIDVNITPIGTTVLPGGAAYFAAIAASRIISPIGLVTRIGYDFDPSFLFKRVLSDGIHLIPDTKTARSIQTYHSLNDLTDRDISLEWGVAPGVCVDDIPKAWLPDAEYAHIATMPPIQQRSFISYLRKKAQHVRISIDTDIFLIKKPNYKKVIEQNFRDVDMVFVNQIEYVALQSVVSTLPHVVLKKDKEGANFLEHGEIIAISISPHVRAVDVTGAGDIFAGTFLAMRVKDASIKDALHEATYIASESVIKNGVAHLFQ